MDKKDFEYKIKKILLSQFQNKKNLRFDKIATRGHKPC